MRILKKIRRMSYIHKWKNIHLLKFSVFVIVLFFIIFFIISPIVSYNENIKANLTKNTVTDNSNRNKKPGLKYILIWPHINGKHRYLGGQKEFINQNCVYTNCFLTYNKFLLNDTRNFEAIVFDVLTLNSIKNRKILRDPRQKYIFKSLKANHISVCQSKYDDFFNWTWTYRLSSDIPHPFFDIYDVNKKIVGPSINMEWIEPMIHKNVSLDIFKKSKAVAWLSYKTKCVSVNSHYVNELKEELKGYNYTVDSFGPCGNKRCPTRRISDCYDVLKKDYYFSLVLEDYNDVDFVTTKAVRAMKYSTVPIVMSGANLSRFLPPGSYVDAQSFDIKKTGALINHLMLEKNSYTYFLDWKNHYTYKEKSRNDVCGLCTKLNHDSFKKFSSYKYFRHSWDPDYRKSCHREF